MSNIYYDDKERTANALEKLAGFTPIPTIHRQTDKRIADAVEKIAESGIPSGGGSDGDSVVLIQADWDELDSNSPAYIQNKPFGIKGREVVFPETIFTVTSENQGAFNFDEPHFGVSATDDYIITLNGEEYFCTPMVYGTSSSEFELVDTNDVNGYSKFYLDNFALYLEDDLHGGPLPNGDYALKIERVVYYEKRDTILPETVLTPSEINYGFASVAYNNDYLIVDDTYIVTYDGNEYRCRAFYGSNNGDVTVMTLTDSGTTSSYDIFEVSSGDNNMIYYKADSLEETHTIKIEHVSRATMERKYVDPSAVTNCVIYQGIRKLTLLEALNEISGSGAVPYTDKPSKL